MSALHVRIENNQVLPSNALSDLAPPVTVDSFTLPHMDELLAALKGSSVFNTIDLPNAYYQVPLHEDSSDLTAFITHDGL